MSKPKSVFTVRAFNAFNETADPTLPKQFSSFGVMEQFSTYSETVVTKLHEAITEMLVGPNAHPFSARNLKAMPAGVINSINDVRADQSAPVPEVVMLDLSIALNIYNKDELKDVREAVKEALKRFAEKSRVRGARGWRISAVKTPRFELDETSGAYVLKTKILLGTSVYYDQDTVSIGVEENIVLKDLSNLKKHLSKVTNDRVHVLNYNHSEIGKGQL